MEFYYGVDGKSLFDIFYQILGAPLDLEVYQILSTLVLNDLYCTNLPGQRNPSECVWLSIFSHNVRRRLSLSQTTFSISAIIAAPFWVWSSLVEARRRQSDWLSCIGKWMMRWVDTFGLGCVNICWDRWGQFGGPSKQLLCHTLWQRHCDCFVGEDISTSYFGWQLMVGWFKEREFFFQAS